MKVEVETKIYLLPNYYFINGVHHRKLGLGLDNPVIDLSSPMKIDEN